MREARFQEVCNSFTRAGNNRKQSNGGQGNGPTPQGNSNVLGIPTKFYTDNTLCIRFNKGECKEKARHKHKTQEYTLLHKCAGCLKTGVDTEGHGVHDIRCPMHAAYQDCSRQTAGTAASWVRYAAPTAWLRAPCPKGCESCTCVPHTNPAAELFGGGTVW